MKKFSLSCEHEHEFEGWFADAEAFRQQLDAGLLDCPYCGSRNLEKLLSGPNLSTPKTKSRIKNQYQDVLTQTDDLISTQETATTPLPSEAMSLPAGRGEAAFRMAVRALHQKLQAEFTNVGDKFAKEARIIHARNIKGEKSETQNIYGTCTAEEHRELSEDGIDILPLPELPPEH